jgi:hypothetical protein
MMSLLARPWIRLPHLLAIYFALAIGAPFAFFVVYEVAVFLHSFGPSTQYLSPTTILILIILACIVIPSTYKALTRQTHERKQELSWSPEFAAELTSLFAAVGGFGVYLQERADSEKAYRQSILIMEHMIRNVHSINLTDEHLAHFREMKERLDEAGKANEFEYHTLLTRFLLKYDEAHQSKA